MTIIARLVSDWSLDRFFLAVLSDREMMKAANKGKTKAAPIKAPIQEYNVNESNADDDDDKPQGVDVIGRVFEVGQAVGGVDGHGVRLG